MKKKHYAKGMTQAEYMREWRAGQKKLIPLLARVQNKEVMSLRPTVEAIMKRVQRGTLGRRSAATIILKVIEMEVEALVKPA